MSSSSVRNQRSNVSFESGEFRQELSFEHGIHIGHFSKEGLCFIDNEYIGLKPKLSALVHIPAQCLSFLQEPIVQQIQTFVKHSRSTLITEANDPAELCLQTSNPVFAETWGWLLKIPQQLLKLSAKNEELWRSNVYSVLYRFVLGDIDSMFDEDREINVPSSHSLFPLIGKDKLDNVYLVGVAKSRQIRSLLKALKQKNFQPRHFMTNDTLLPFFVSVETSNHISQFQAENELVVAMQLLHDVHARFFGAETKPLFGLTCVGTLVTGFLLRKRVMNNDILYCLQPLDTYNLMLYDDLLRIAKFLVAVRMHGLELANEVIQRMQYTLDPQSQPSCTPPTSVANTTTTRDQQVASATQESNNANSSIIAPVEDNRREQQAVQQDKARTRRSSPKRRTPLEQQQQQSQSSRKHAPPPKRPRKEENSSTVEVSHQPSSLSMDTMISDSGTQEMEEILKSQ